MIELDRRFPVPRGVVDVRLDETEFVDFVESPQDYTDSMPRGETLRVPTEFRIVSQRVRYLSDGTSVVDLVLDFPNSDDNLEYDVRYYQK